MTENHRAEGRLESVRLRRMMGTGVIADSFGDSRYVCSVFYGMRMPISWKVDGRPRKYKEVCSTLADILPWTSAHQLTAWET